MRKPRYIFVDPEKSMEENIEHSIKVEELVKKELEKERKD